MRRLVVLLLALSACGRFGFSDESRVGIDADVMRDGALPSCSFGPWSTPAPIAELESPVEDWDAAQSPDGATLVFSRRTGDYDLYIATFDGTAYSTPVRVDTLDTASDDSGPAWSPDGQTFYFSSNRAMSGYRLYTSTFDGTSFGPAVLVDSLATVEVLGATIAPSNLELFYSAAPFAERLRRATRTSTTAPWTDLGIIPELDAGALDGYPTLSPDALTMYFDSTRGGGRTLYSTTRATTAAMWMDPAVIADLDSPGASSDPDLSRDGRRIVFASTRQGTTGSFDLFVSTRDCQ